MKTYCTMTNQELIETHRNLVMQKEEIGRNMIEDGQGHLRLTDMRADDCVHAHATEYISLVDELTTLWAEGSMRYGPGLITFENLLEAQGPRYRRIREKANV